jgi:tetratricopeptide (TPR) repeat protein
MKKTILLSLFPLLFGSVLGQQREAAEKLVEEGIGYHDKGDYEAAITRYEEALLLDKDNLFALGEKALSLMLLKKYDESIEVCKKAVAKHKGEKELRSVYVTYGNAYDALKKPDRSLKVYDEGISQFPDFYLLYFNKGVTLAGLDKLDEAIVCFQKSASLEPGHASSHNALGRLLYSTGKRIPALLAFSRFSVLEPQSGRAKGNLKLLQGITKANVEKSGENSINISIPSSMLSDTTADGKSKENSFATTDLILSMDAALDYDKKNEGKTEVEQFMRKFETVCASLKETQADNFGFYWDYYVPYFIELKEKDFVEVFSYIAFAASDNAVVNNWIKTHREEVDRFFEWSKSFKWPGTAAEK